MIQPALLTALRKQNPLVVCLTNTVTINDVANGLLAIGASPVMGDEVEDVVQMVAHASGLLINTGTLSGGNFEMMKAAAEKANARQTPVVVDPVGIGATAYRKNFNLQLLQAIRVDAIRGNAGEIAALAEIEWQSKGVDAGEGDHESVVAAAKKVAQQYQTLVAVSGVSDFITDGKQVVRIDNGTALFPKMTGSGCLFGGIAAAFLAMENSLTALETAAATYAIAGEKASEIAEGPGSFRLQLMDALYQLNEADVKTQVKMEVVING